MDKQMKEFRELVREELIKIDESLKDMEIPDGAIINAINQNRTPSDVAWALTQ